MLEEETKPMFMHDELGPEYTRAAATPPLLEVKGVTLQYKTKEHLVTAPIE